ncbi:MAG: DUF3179 domain-containing protein [Bacteroidota bacterium]
MGAKQWILAMLMGLMSLPAVRSQSEEVPSYRYFIDLLHSTSKSKTEASLDQIEQEWEESFELYAVETLYFLDESQAFSRLLLLLQDKTGEGFGVDFNAWYAYLWNKDPMYDEDYFSFKAALHAPIDRRFVSYFFGREAQSEIRLDEVRWGGVKQDGIPPLRNPTMIEASKARYLSNSDVVFGIEVNGEARAYPKRILAWHELFTDRIGNTPVAGVYCTLCGTVILYKTQHDGHTYELGTSGFLYRSNKLMYDRETQSLWNTLWGQPVLGPLAGKGIQLEYLSVVTTTWGTWKRQHPDTKVLSLQTGHRRDYSEGAAYRDYFATDQLMFNVPTNDRRLKNKQEVLVIRLPEETDEAIAISSKYLRKNPIYGGTIDGKSFTVFTDKSDAHRAFFTQGYSFVSYDKNGIATDSDGGEWLVTEGKLKRTTGERSLPRLHTFNGFWFGVRAAFPTIQLIP